MQRILTKRVLRSLKKNFFRYLALMLMIVLSMYLVVSLVAAADTVILGTAENSADRLAEDGHFTVFIPLTEEETEKIEDMGVTLEKAFYEDICLERGRTLRVFRNRKNIDLLTLIEGREPENDKEIVLDRRFCEVGGISVGNKIDLAGKNYTVCGIGVTPDYEGEFKTFADASVDSSSFGTAFVTDELYEALLDTDKVEKAEEYLYIYRLGSGVTNDELKELLESFEFDAEQSDDRYFRDYWDKTGGKKDELEDAINDIAEGIDELSDGLSELSGNSRDLNDAAGKVMDAYLAEASATLAGTGIREELTAENYHEKLSDIIASAKQPAVSNAVKELLGQLDSVKEFTDGIREYTEGTDDANDGAEELREGYEELRDKSRELLDRFGEEVSLSNLEMFVPAEDNPRMNCAGEDQQINKFAGLLAGVIIMMLLTYVISVFVTHEIEEDSSIIGTLYALGVTKNDLLLHYLLLPVIITFIAGVAGMLIGFNEAVIHDQMKDSLDYFSLPEMKALRPAYLAVYSAVMPPLVAVIVNTAVISGKLKKSALSLIRRENRQPKFSRIKLHRMGFVNKFRIRQLIRELRSSLTVVMGMFIALVLLMLGLNIYTMCAHIKEDNKKDVHFEYMYTYKYPDDTVPEGGYEVYNKKFRMNSLGYDMDVSMMGLTEEQPFFDVTLSGNSSDVVITSAMAQKFALKKGDEFIAREDGEDKRYVFTVYDITQYSPGFCFFMDIDGMRELFGADDDYFNMVLSDRELGIESGKLYAVTSRTDIAKASDVYLTLMWPMIYTMLTVSVIVFAVVMFLMMKVMLDRSAQSISLLQIFGYRTGEIRKLYLDVNFFLIAVGAAIAIPLAKLIMDRLYPYMVANASSAMDLHFSWKIYLIIYLCTLLLYFIINRILVFRIRKVKPADILKNRE